MMPMIRRADFLPGCTLTDELSLIKKTPGIISRIKIKTGVYTKKVYQTRFTDQ
jgi:hypothetical protein